MQILKDKLDIMQVIYKDKIVVDEHSLLQF